MPEEQPKTIPIFEVAEVIEGRPVEYGARPIQARGVPERAIQLVETSVEVMSQNMAKFIAGVTEVFAAGARAANAFEIETVEVECKISGTGKIGLAGTGFDLQGGSTLKIIFKKKA